MDTKLPGPRERMAFWTVWLLSGLFQYHAALNNGAMGQDFLHNYGACIQTARHFSDAWVLARTNPPGFHFMAAAVIWLVGVIRGISVIGLINTGFNLVALVMFYRLSIRLVQQPVFRLGLLTLVAFLPVRLIQGVVIASDALAPLPYFVLALLLVHLVEASDPRQRHHLAGGICLVLTIGLFIKYLFMSSLVAVLIVLAQAVRRQKVAVREALRLGLLCIALPIVTLLVQVQTQTSFQSNFGMHGTPADNMRYASVFGVHAADPHVLDAPRYDEPNLQPDKIPIFQSPDNDHDTRYELMIPNRYSYLALLHWGTFTDPLNIFQHRTTSYTTFGERSARHQFLMTLAVRTALPITVACVISVALLIYRVGKGALFSPNRTSASVEAVLLLGLGWFSNIALLMPRVHGAYLGGYWTPRLVLPALLTFLLLTFHALDERFQGRAARIGGGIVLGFILCQSILQATFLWI